MITWVDIETTGLDPLRSGHILELGAIITDDALIETARRSWLIAPATGPNPRNWHLDDFTAEMHTASGLIEEVMSGGEPNWQVDAEIAEWVRDMNDGRPALMAGNSIHFDRSWIKTRLRKTDEAFGYRMVDVSSFKELVARWWPGHEYRVEGDKPHRALPDIEHSIAELRYYASRFMNVSWLS